MNVLENNKSQIISYNHKSNKSSDTLEVKTKKVNTCTFIKQSSDQIEAKMMCEQNEEKKFIDRSIIEELRARRGQLRLRG